jgi:hypothetical protein
MISIRFDDHDDRRLSFDLRDVLSCLGQEQGNSFLWKIFEATGVTRDGSSSSRELMKKVEKSQSGVEVTWDDLKLFGEELVQLEMGLIAGRRSPWPEEQVPQHEGALSFALRRADVVIEAFDASYWTVYSDRMDLIQRFQERFHSAKVLGGGS